MPTPWYLNATMYGIDVSRFFDTNNDGVGDLPGVTAKLDYLQQLGVTCVWLLPFYPSPRKDNGYDVTNYKDVDARFGTLADFRELVAKAHSRDIKIIIDLVIHHTSSEHPWFQAASADPTSHFHDYYVWAEDPKPEPNDANAFPDVEDGVWQFVRPLNAYYHHRFYHFQPDLNIAHPQVMHEIKEIIDFWLAFDVDGFRIDAATHMFEQKGVSRAKVEGGSYLKELHLHANKRKKDVALLGEADVPYHDVKEYTHNGDRLNMLFNFLFNNQLFLALAREEAQPLRSHLQQTRDSHADVTWVNFARNLDEINLRQLSRTERQEVFDAFAPQAHMQIYGRGIRRGLPPMLTPLQLRLVYSLVAAAPGTPLFVYGAEIGMGDDLTRTGRDSVRLPMQWSDAIHGGFSTHAPANAVGDALEEGKFGYPNVNVRQEQNDDSSLWHFLRHIMKLRRQYTINTAQYTLPYTKNPAILAIEYDRVITYHNLSARQQTFHKTATHNTVLLGEDCRKSHTLSPYGISWLMEGEK